MLQGYIEREQVYLLCKENHADDFLCAIDRPRVSPLDVVVRHVHEERR